MPNLFDETSGKFEADLLGRTVEGIENPASYGFVDGVPYLSPPDRTEGWPKPKVIGGLFEKRSSDLTARERLACRHGRSGWNWNVGYCHFP